MYNFAWPSIRIFDYSSFTKAWDQNVRWDSWERTVSSHGVKLFGNDPIMSLMFGVYFLFYERWITFNQMFDREDITNTKLRVSYKEHQIDSISKLKILLYPESLRSFKTNYCLLSKIKEGKQNHITGSL